METKQYVKAFLVSQYGEKPIMNNKSSIGNKFCGLLSHTGDYTDEKIHPLYNSKIKLYISVSTFKHDGFILSPKKKTDFNYYVENLIKMRFRLSMDIMIDLEPSFAKNLPYVREKLGIDLNAWDTDSMKKDYYRYRLKTGKPLLYKK